MQAFKILTKKHELHYCSAFIEVRSGGTVGANTITPDRYRRIPFAKNENRHFQKGYLKSNTKVLKKFVEFARKNVIIPFENMEKSHNF